MRRLLPRACLPRGQSRPHRAWNPELKPAKAPWRFQIRVLQIKCDDVFRVVGLLIITASRWLGGRGDELGRLLLWQKPPHLKSLNGSPHRCWDASLSDKAGRLRLRGSIGSSLDGWSGGMVLRSCERAPHSSLSLDRHSARGGPRHIKDMAGPAGSRSSGNTCVNDYVVAVAPRR